MRKSTKTAEAEPALFAMKDVTPKKGDDKKPEPDKKPAKAKQEPSKAVAVAKPQRAPAKAAPLKEPTNMLAVIARAASDPRVNPENMRMMLDMQKEIVAEEARMAFNEDFIAMQSELPVINAKGRIEIKAKDSKGDRTGPVQQSTPYATFNEIARVTKPILQKHHFAMSFSTDQATDGRVIVKGFLKHARGHQETTTLALPLETSGSKNNVQGFGSSMSYGKRYAAIALLNLVSEAMEDRDTDGVVNEPTRNDEPARLSIDKSVELVGLINESGLKLERFLEKYKIKAVIDLDPKLFQEAVQSCRNYAAEKKKAETR